MPGTIDAGYLFTFLETTIIRTPRTKNIKAFQCEANRIELCMTARTCFRFRMLTDQFPNRLGTPYIGFHRGDTWGRWWGRLANQAIHDPCPAQDRRGTRTIR